MSERDLFMQNQEQYRLDILDLERQLSELEARYDKDQVLWENQFSFLTQQRDQAKLDQQEAVRKFETVLEELHLRGTAEKDKIETTQQTLLSNIDSKYKQQLKELQEQHSKEKLDLTERLRNLDKDNRSL